ncbi:MAG TPA: hypothetical protein VKA43_06375 [Gammaproteobacteria bacterium]|nr:hypothetical protein [Gammaproteobacteria bacterium]
MILSGAGLSGCGVTSQLHSELSYGGAAENALALESAGIGVLTPAAPTGQESDKQALGESLGAALQSELASTRVLGLPEMLSAINRAGLAGNYAKTLADYENTGILDRDTLHAIGEASGVRYLAKLNLGNFNQSSDKRLAIAGIRMFDTWRATIRVHLEVWDADTGEIAWQGNDELVYAREGVKERPVTFRQVADVAARNLVQKVGTSGTESLDQDPETVASR